MKISFTLNNEPVELEAEGTLPLLWVIRDYLGLKGTKFGCGKAACGACTVMIDENAIRCCTYPAGMAEGKKITTIEGLGTSTDLHPVQQAWIEEIVPQCGYCQSGFMMAAAALIQKNPQPSDDEIDQQILNICRCGTHYRIRKAIHRAAAIQLQKSNDIIEDQNG